MQRIELILFQPKSTLRVPLESLPDSVNERHAYLRNYFCDKDAAATLTDHGWLLHLHWSNDQARHVDPNLDSGLAWWNAQVRLDTMSEATRRDGIILHALYDTWTLFSWSQWLARRGSMPKELVVLHVDDHRDIAPPRLFMDGEGFRDGITGAEVDLLRPETIHAAILSGAIGMGSFLTPWLHLFPSAVVRHLCQAPKAPRTLDYRFHLDVSGDDLLEPGRPRPAIRLDSTERGGDRGSYRMTPDVAVWLQGLHEVRAPVLLHIDLDYFNNRYDGDSDWSEKTGGLDPPIKNVMAKVDELFDALIVTGVGRHVEDVVIAYSPGFFPVEFWAQTSERVLAGLARLHA